MPLDPFLWWHIKDIVYKTPVTSFDELKQTIVNTIETFASQMLENNCRETEYRFYILRAMKSVHVELV
jgi:hypothetical protein